MNNPRGNIKAVIKKLTEEITQTQLKIANLDFTPLQLLIMREIDKDKLLGSNGEENLKNILMDNLGDYNAMMAETKTIANNLRILQTTCQAIQNITKPFINNKIYNVKQNKQEETITLIFQANASVDTLEKLEDRIEQWRKISHWLKITGESQDFEIISFSDGSCKITLKNTLTAVKTLAGLVTFCLSSYSIYLDIKIKEHQIEQIKKERKVEEEKPLKESEKPIIRDSELKKISEEAAIRQLNLLGIDKSNPKYPESLANLTKASQYIITFIDDGGEASPSTELSKDKHIAQMQNYFEKVRSIKKISNMETPIVQFTPEKNRDDNL